MRKIPYTRAAVRHVAARVQQVQEYLGRSILVENLSSYLEFAGAEMAEWEFAAEVVRTAGCKLLLDVNNVYVNACNHGYDAARFIDAIAPDTVAEFHLAGHSRRQLAGGVTLLIATPAPRVGDAVWAKGPPEATREVFERVTLGDELPEFLTLIAYEKL